MLRFNFIQGVIFAWRGGKSLMKQIKIIKFIECNLNATFPQSKYFKSILHNFHHDLELFHCIWKKYKSNHRRVGRKEIG